MSTTPKHRDLVATRAEDLAMGDTVARTKHLSATVVSVGASREPRLLTGWVPRKVARLLHLSTHKTVVFLRFTDGEARVRGGRRFQVVVQDAGLIWQRASAIERAATVTAVERRARQLTPTAG